MKFSRILLPTVLLALTGTLYGQQDSLLSLREMAIRALEKNETIRNKELASEKASIDKNKAYMAYLPKVNLEAAYTHMNDNIAFPPDLVNLLNGAQALLIKEQLAMGSNGAINFHTPHQQVVKPDGTTLGNVIAQNSKEIPPIQDQNFFKANANAQILLFSGLKVPNTIKAVNHQLASLNLLTQAEIATTLLDLVITYDQYAIIRHTNKTLDQTEKLLREQQRFVEKALSSGLTIAMSRQRIELALEQLNVKKIELATAQKVVAMRLAQLTGLETAQIETLTPELKPWMINVDVVTTEDRPEIKALNEAILATGYKKRAEYSEYIPKLFAFGRYEFYKDNLTLLDPEWYVGIGLRWTIFDGLAARNNAKQIKIDQQMLENQRNQTIEMANIKLEKERLDQQKNILLIENANKQVVLAADVLNLSTKQFEQGLITMNEHLAAITEYEKTCLDQIKAIAAQRASALELLIAGGKLTLETIQ